MKTVEHPLSARDRLLAAADELFYREGINSVGIDRVIEQAGVAKATLYNSFGSKDELVRAYLAGRHAARVARLKTALAGIESPADRILAVFDSLEQLIVDRGFGGCAFLNAAAEARSGSAVEAITGEYRGWLRTLFRDLAADAGAADPDQVAVELVLLYDGATVGAKMDRNPGAARAARSMAAALLAR